MKTIATVVIYKNITHIGITNVKESYEDVRSFNFLMCDEAYIENYIKTKFITDMGDITFAPDGYGLLVFDFDKKRLLSRHDYCDYYGILYSDYYSSNSEAFNATLPNLYDMKILIPTKWNPKNRVYDKVDISSDTSFNDVIRIMKDSFKFLYSGKFNEVIITDLNINYEMLGWEYIKFRSYKDYRTYLETNGYQIDKKYFIEREKNEN